MSTYVRRTRGQLAMSLVGTVTLSILALACGNGEGRKATPNEPPSKPAVLETGEAAMLSFRVDGMRRVNGAL